MFRVLDRFFVRDHRQGHAGAMGPAEKTGHPRPLSACPQFDDHKRAVDVAGRGADAAILADRMVGLFFFAANSVYFPLSEEKGLERRFGDDYRTYKANVPRWVPRLTAWRPPDEP